MRKRILDQPIDLISKDEAVYRIKTALINPKPFKIITLNPEMVIRATKDIEFQAAINNAHLIVPDGTGIVWGLKLINPGCTENLKRIPGIELAENILEEANELSKKIAIFGGKKETIERINVKLREKYPNINFVKTIDGFQGKGSDESIAREIALSKPDIVLVALGTPRQEIWINKYSSLFPNSIMIGIGGSLDIWSGQKQRAPQWIRDIHLEWFYRVMNEPKRIPRILASLPVFVFLILKNKYFRTNQTLHQHQ